MVGVAVQKALVQAEYDKYEHPNTSHPQNLYSFFDKTEVESEISATCDFSTLFPTKREISKLKTHTKILKRANTDGGRASARALKADWAYRVSTDKYPLNVDAELIEPSKTGLIKMFKSNSKLMPTEAADWLEFWSGDIAKIIAKKCHVPSNNSTWQSVATVYNSAISSAEVAAANVPWYPDGYQEWSGDSTLAWKWTSGTCELGDYCWHVQVITEFGCSSSLYGELNLLDGSDNVIGYTNDLSGSLGPNARVILEFSTYEQGVSSGRLTELSCY